MESISIPAAVVESPEYAQLTLGEKMFLLDLYIVMNDVERFTINIGRPQDYRQARGAWLPRRINRLVDAGFLVVDGKHGADPCHRARVFRFKHSPAGELRRAA